MYVLLIAFLFVQIFFLFLKLSDFCELRLNLLKAGLIFSTFIAASTEVLSLFSALTSTFTIIWWATFNVLLAAYIFARFRKRGLADSLTAFSQHCRENFSNLKGHRVDHIFAGAILIVCVPIVVIAWAAPPNTADSLTYHMARVANWVQSGTVAFYPTATLRQLYQAPFSEYTILHLYLLNGSDRLANFVQFFSFIGCAVAVSLIVKLLGLGRLAQLSAALLTMSIPGAVIQASSTKNDLVASFFVVVFAYFFLRAVESNLVSEFLFSGIALGLAVFSKSTALIFSFPVGLLILVFYLYRQRARGTTVAFLSKTAILLAIAFAINAPQFARNYQTFGAPVTSSSDIVTNRKITLPIVGSNFLRTFSQHLAAIPQVDEQIESIVRTVLGSEVDNPDSTYMGLPFAIEFSLHETSVGNLLHTILLSIVFLMVFVDLIRRRTVSVETLLCLSIFGGFLSFCVLLQWQPWGGRLLLPLFILGVPVIVSKLSRFPAVLPRVVLLCVAISIAYSLKGEPRPLLAESEKSVLTASRFDQYFASAPILKGPYLEAATLLKEKNASEIGLSLETNDPGLFGTWEYLFRITMNDNFASPPHFRHVNVNNASAKKDISPPPEWVIAANDEKILDGVEYKEIWRMEPLRILQRAQ